MRTGQDSLVNPLDILLCLYRRRKNKNKETISFKMEDYTITLHRGEEELKEIEQKRMARYVTCLCNMAIKLRAKHFEEYCPELQPEVCNILKKAESKILNGEILKPKDFK